MQTPAPSEEQHQAPIELEVQQAEKQFFRKGLLSSDGYKVIHKSEMFSCSKNREMAFWIAINKVQPAG